MITMLCFYTFSCLRKNYLYTPVDKPKLSYKKYLKTTNRRSSWNDLENHALNYSS